eukprot:SAG11_NODE_965_length_6360_cov_11.622584_3_plen_62_part_00
MDGGRRSNAPMRKQRKEVWAATARTIASTGDPLWRLEHEDAGELRAEAKDLIPETPLSIAD